MPATRVATPPPSGASWREVARRSGHRHAMIGALRGAALALLFVSPWLVHGITMARRTANAQSWIASAVLGCLCALIGAVIGWWLARPNPRSIAELLEQRVPALQNLLVTAEELDRAPAGGRAEPAMRALIEQRASDHAARVDPVAVFPIASSVRALAVSGVIFVAATAAGHYRLSSAPALGRAGSPTAFDAAMITDVTVQVTPPAYARQAVVTQRDPTRVEALQGSRLRFTVRADIDTVQVTTKDSAIALVPNRDGVFVYEAVASADGFIGLESRSARATNGGERRLIGLTVRTDDAPRVRIVAPATDLLVPDANRTLSVRVQADDDLAIGTLRVKYTKVAGSGERFTFSEGELPVQIARTSGRSWTGRAELALAPLLQEPGDLVVYRAVVTDSRPGADPIESDALIAELAAPGGVAALGFALDPDEDRYALSQQMVIQKTERLVAQRSTLTPAQVAEQATQLAGEQRRVRAEFVFMMGGEFAQQATGEDGMMELDEHEEAESEGDLAAGRMVNRGRTALLAAVRAMSRAAVALTTADLTPALEQERRALVQLQEAFARNRFLMRALSQREQLDLTRRLSGVREGIATQGLRVPQGEMSERQRALRAILTDLTDFVVVRDVTTNGSRTRGASSLVDIATRLLQVDPSSPVAQRVATQLTAAGQQSLSARTRVAPSTQALLDSAATGLTSMLRSEVRPSATSSRSLDARRLQSALDEALGAGQRSPRLRPRTP
jgi:hypothetical protein